jgi:hypothetical protein
MKSGRVHRGLSGPTARAVASVCLLLGACVSPPPAAQPDQTAALRFSDVTAEAGIDFRYTFGDRTYENILESSGSGVTVFDYDGDGDLDLYLLNGTYLEGISDPEGEAFAGARNHLYRNEGSGRFRELAQQAGLDDRRWSMAAAPYDFDADGNVDVFLANYGPNAFYRNRGDGTFEEVAEEVGLLGPEELNGFTKWSVGGAVWDQDEDGLADLMVGNFLAFDPDYVSPATPDMMPHPSEYDGQASLFYRQRSDGTFQEVTEELGLFHPESMCMGLTVFDYDRDGDLDLFQGNDHQRNFLFRNESGGRFSQVADEAGIAVNNRGLATGSMHGSPGDVDGDGLIDLLVTDLRWGALYRNLGDGSFEDVTAASGVETAFRGKGAWAATLVDLDNDGDLDVFSANGVAEELVLQPPLLLLNDGRGSFRDAGRQASGYFRRPRSGRGAAAWDYDEDGDLDITVSHVDLEATATHLRNELNSEGDSPRHWLRVDLGGHLGPPRRLGAFVTVTTADGSRVAIHQWATSYLSYNDPRVHFGLGEAAIAERLEIDPPGPGVLRLLEPPVDRTLVFGAR